MTPVQPSGYVWLDGGLVPWSDASIHVLTHAFNHGTGAFEGMRCRSTATGPAVFRLRDHLERLRRTAAALRMDLPGSVESIAHAVTATIRANELSDCYLRLVVFRAYGEVGILADAAPVGLTVAAWRQPPSFPAEKAAAGIRATLSGWRRPAPDVVPPGKVTGAYATACVARSEAVAAGFDEAILLGPAGGVAEASIENLFLVRGGVLATPRLADGPLAGITRDSVMRLARDAGIPLEERAIAPAELHEADELFLTGTGAGIVPVREVDGHVLGGPGPVFGALSGAYLRAATGADERYPHWLHPIAEAAQPAYSAAER